jgi:hypothetical protein
MTVRALRSTAQRIQLPTAEAAALAGVGPIPASSGRVTRHRLM